MDPLLWLLITLVGLIGAVWTMIEKHVRTRPVVPGKSEAELVAEAKAKKDEQAAIAKRDAAVDAAKDEADKENDELVKDLEEDQSKLLEDNDALTDHLKDVGKNVRGG